MRRAYSLVHLHLIILGLSNTRASTGQWWRYKWIVSLLVCYLLLCFSGSVHYDEGESEAESMTSNMDMSNPIFQLYEAVRGARNSQGQLISEPFLQLPSRKDYPDYYHQISQPICLHQIKYDTISTDLALCVCYHTVCQGPDLLFTQQHWSLSSCFSTFSCVTTWTQRRFFFFFI